MKFDISQLRIAKLMKSIFVLPSNLRNYIRRAVHSSFFTLHS